MSATKAKHVVYYYDGDQKNPEEEQDLGGDVTIPTNGSVIWRRGKSWNVIKVDEEQFTDGRIPVFKIFLATPQSS